MAKELEGGSDFHIESGRLKLGTEGATAAIMHLLDGLQRAPSLALLREAVELAAKEKVMQDDVLEAGAEVLSLNLQVLPRYRCDNCGFELRHLHWSCPGCSCWGMVKPINDLIVAVPDTGAASSLEHKHEA